MIDQRYINTKRNHRSIVLAVVLAIFAISGHAEDLSPSRQEPVQLSRVTLTEHLSGNSIVTYTFTNTTDQTIVFYPELYDLFLCFVYYMDTCQCPTNSFRISRGRIDKSRNFDLSRKHTIRLQSWGSEQYTTVYKTACEKFENVQSMTLEVHFRGHEVRDLYDVPLKIYTNDVCAKIKMDVTIDGDTLSAEPARKDADEQGR